MRKLFSSKVFTLVLAVITVCSFTYQILATSKDFKFTTNEKFIGKVPLTILSGTEFDNFGAAKSGLRSNGTWTQESDGSYTQSYLGGGWCNLWNKSALKESYKATVDVKLMTEGTSSDYPKFGMYAGYKDNDNFLLVMFDVKFNSFASFARISGKDKGWKASTIPAGTDLKTANELKVIKSGNEFRIYVNGYLIEIENEPIDKAQTGFVTEDCVTSYNNFKLTETSGFDISKPSIRKNGFGNSVSGSFQTNGWNISSEKVSLDLIYSGWNSIYYGDSLSKNYTFDFDIQLTEQAKDAQYPKYGAYAYYLDKDNYIVAMFDPKYKQFVSMERKAGKDGEWKGTAVNFDFEKQLTVKCVKNSDRVYIFANGIMYYNYKCSTGAAQPGFATWESSASYTKISYKNTAVASGYFGVSADGSVSVNGNWSYDGALKQTYLGKGLTSLFYGINTMDSYTASADIRLINSGMSLFPKYGIYAANSSANTFIWFFIHPKEYIVSSFTKVNGVDKGWQTAKLPLGFDFKSWHSIASVKNGSKVSLIIDNIVYLTVDAKIGKAQFGFVTEDCAAEYKNPVFK